MKNLFVLFLLSAFMATIFPSCKKDALKKTGVNTAPIADAGVNQQIQWPTDSVFLDGSGSSDPDGSITSYKWSKISGPSTFLIHKPTAIQTLVHGLTAGVYQFMLTATDNGGLSAVDTVQVTVVARIVDCDNSNRPTYQAYLFPIGTLSESRSGVAVAAAGDKILFAGGNTPNSVTPYSATVDIYDVKTEAWSVAKLSLERSGIAAIGVGTKVYFAGGVFYGGCANIDVYDVTTNSWSQDSLSAPRTEIAVGTVGNKIVFAGGVIETGMAGECSSQVDIYDLSNNSWTTTSLEVGRAAMSAVTVKNKIYFASGLRHLHDDPTDRIEVYDNTTNSWSVSRLNEPRGGLAALAVGDKIYWSGGTNGKKFLCSIEIHDVATGASSIDYLSKSGVWPKPGAGNVALHNGKIVFLPRQDPYYDPNNKPNNRFDIYDTVTGAWSIGVLPVNSFSGGSMISVNNKIYIADAIINGVVSNQVWQLEF